MCIEPRDLPTYAVQHIEGCWRVLAPCDDPHLPPIIVADVIDVAGDQAYANTCVSRRSPDMMIRSFTVERRPILAASRINRTRGEIGNLDWREQVLELARLVDFLQPEHDPETFHLRKLEVARGLRRLARWHTA